VIDDSITEFIKNRESDISIKNEEVIP